MDDDYYEIPKDQADFEKEFGIVKIKKVRKKKKKKQLDPNMKLYNDNLIESENVKKFKE